MIYLVYSDYRNTDWVVKAEDEANALWKVLQEDPKAGKWNIFAMEMFAFGDVERISPPPLGEM